MKSTKLVVRLLFLVVITILLGACRNTGIDGEWELSQEKQDNCPIYYKFETVVKKDKKETIIKHFTEMYTNAYVKDDFYKGTYNQINKGDSYTIDYGNSFISNQNIKRNKDNLEVSFNNPEKLCVYKKAVK